MALWCAPNFLVQFMNPGVHGAPAQSPVDPDKEQGHGAARRQMGVPPVPTPPRQRAAICHPVQVCKSLKLCRWTILIPMGVKSADLPLSCNRSNFFVPVDGCSLSEWSSWSECSSTCGGGVSTRNKTILQEPEPGGAACVGPLRQHTVCNTNSCMPGNTNTPHFKTLSLKTSFYDRDKQVRAHRMELRTGQAMARPKM